MNIEFAISSWAACAPGLSSEFDWRRWAAKPWLPLGVDCPLLPQMAALSRRRLGQLGRMVCSVAFASRRADETMPVVLGSRHGDSARSLGMLASMAQGQPMSPAGFAMSVHNAIGAMYSMACGDTASQVAITGGAETAATCIVEAAGLLAEGAPEVLVLCYDSPLPERYAEFADEPEATYAWAWRLRASDSATPSEHCFRLSSEPACRRPGAPSGASPSLPFGLDALRFMLSQESRSTCTAGATDWTWHRGG